MGEVRFKYLSVPTWLSSIFFKANQQDLADDLIYRLFRLMNQEKPYLKSNFSLEHLANHLQVSSCFLTQVINAHLEQNFFDLVAYYRIQEAKKMLENPKIQQKVVDDLAYEVGYKSISLFHNDFQKHTNQTPNEYKKQMNLIGE